MSDVESSVAWTEITHLCAEALSELVSVAGLIAGQVVVIGASTSEIAGKRIGTGGSRDVATAVLDGLWPVAEQRDVRLVFQCCEHLNRALVMERSTLLRFGLEEVTAVPVPGAGGAVAAAAYRRFTDPVLALSVAAHAGMDIGDTLIGMHLRRVAVPVRLAVREIGQAHVNAARTRPLLIGGERAVYDLGNEDCL